MSVDMIGEGSTYDPLQLLDTQQTAALLSVKSDTLTHWRYLGGGPKFVKIGRSVRYRRVDLFDYIQSNTWRTNAERSMSA
ncbi:MAG: helix-turn-helix domain-containing protein [Pseudomonadota bacterium]